MTDRVLQHFANSQAFAPPLLCADISCASWMGILSGPHYDEASKAAGLAVSALRPNEHATLTMPTLVNVMKYAYVVARLAEIANKVRHPPYDPTPFRWQCLPRVSLLHAFTGVITVRNHTIYEELLTALYNFAAACLQAVSLLEDRAGTSNETCITAIRLTTIAQYALSGLSRINSESDRVSTGNVSLVCDDTDVDGKYPVMLNDIGLQLSVLCTHATLANLHALCNNDAINADNYMHLHATYGRAYEIIEAADYVPRISVVPQLAERHVAVGRHMALGISYLEKKTELDGEEDSINSGHAAVLANLGRASFGKAVLSIQKHQQVVNVAKGVEALLIDPLSMARKQFQSTVENLQINLGTPAVNPSQVERANAHALIGDNPTFADIPWGEHEWPTAGFEIHFAKKALACAKLLGVDEGTEKILDDLVLVISEALFAQGPTPIQPVSGSTNVQSHPHDTATNANPNPHPPSSADVIAKLPERHRPYGTLLLSLRRYSGLKRNYAKAIEDVSPAARLPLFADRCKIYDAALQSIRCMMCVLFLHQDPESTEYRPTKRVGKAQRDLIEFLSAKPDTERFDAIIRSYKEDVLSKPVGALPDPKEPHFEILMNSMQQLRTHLTEFASDPEK